MTIAAAFFWMFAFIMVGAAAMVIFARNPVHAVLFLILTFFNAAGLFVLLGAEFLAMILVVDFAALRAGFIRYAPLGALVGIIVGLELVMVVLTTVVSPGSLTTASAPVPPGITNTEAIGRVLYTKYAYFFEAAGLVLL